MDLKAANAVGMVDLKRRPSRLREYNTSDFTLHEYCGGFSASLQKCLLEHDLPNDPMKLNESAWQGAPTCHRIWNSYRSCGREFIASVSSVRCAAAVESYDECTSDPLRSCSALEGEALRCLGTKIKLRMSMSGKASDYSTS